MDPASVDDLERTLKALANANRIQLLIALQEPKRLADIHLEPSRRGSAWGSEERAISKQAVRGHIDELVDLGVVETRGAAADLRFVVNHARLYEVTEKLRELATVKATVPVQAHTLERDARGAAASAQGPHLVLVRGVREGQVYPLQGPEPAGGWVVGRAREAQVSLDFDPYVSSAHARIVRREGRHFVMDLLENRNGTLLNWQPMARGGIAPLASGDLIGVGMSMLLYRA